MKKIILGVIIVLLILLFIPGWGCGWSGAHCHRFLHLPSWLILIVAALCVFYFLNDRRKN